MTTKKTPKTVHPEPSWSPQVVGLGMTTLDILMRLDKMPTWERGTRLKDFSFEGGGPVGTRDVHARDGRPAHRRGPSSGFRGRATARHRTIYHRDHVDSVRAVQLRWRRRQ